MTKLIRPTFAFSFFLLLLVSACSNKEKNNSVAQNNLPFINPAIEGVNIAFEEYSFDAQAGSTLLYKSGSILSFPANAFVDQDGNIITGNVNIKYREFSNPIDFLISGIPMDYDSAGIQYNFESSGMCEITATQNNTPIFVNPNNKPEINMATGNKDEGHNLYYLDTTQKKWINKGANTISEVSLNTPAPPTLETVSEELIPTEPAPVKPSKASGEYPVFSIEIEEGTEPELKAYNNLKFEIDPEEKNYDPKVSELEWFDVQIKKASKAGKYIVTFINGQRKVSYLVRPVFEGQDYNQALKIFERKNREYLQLQASRIKKEKTEEREIARANAIIEAQNRQAEKIRSMILAQNEEIEKTNRLIEARNQKVEEVNSNIQRKNEEIKEQRNKMDRSRRVGYLVLLLRSEMPVPESTDKSELEEATKFVEAENAKELLYRSFELDKFGVWNCDRPTLQTGIALKAKFVNKKGEELKLDWVTVAYKDFNGLMQYKDNNIKVLPNSANMICGISDNKMVTLSYEDFEKCEINERTQNYTFVMKVLPEKMNSAEDVKQALVAGY